MPDAPVADISAWLDRLSRHPPSRRGTSPDFLQQLRQTLRRPVDRLLCIAADPEPDLKILSGVMAGRTADVRRGIAVVEQMTARRVTLIDASYPRRHAYPALHPSLLIRRKFGRRLRPARPTTDVGVLMFDAITAAELAAVERGESFELPVVIDDVRDRRRHRISAPAAMSVADVLARVGIDPAGAVITQGAPQARAAVALQTASPTTPTGGRRPRAIGETDLWLRVSPAAPAVSPSACTRCGDCVTACPVDLHPAALLEAVQARDGDMAHAFAISACIECGLCTGVCPSRLPLMESFRAFKRQPENAPGEEVPHEVIE
ncbi:MAG TPA: 4Fe-4S dicluster domain-containing protein [Tepidisphaeraceae bacterium]|jgi:ferredoxin